MAKKRPVVFHNVQPLMKLLHLVTYRRKSLLSLLVLLGQLPLLSRGVSPVFALVAPENPVVQGLPNALQMVRQGKQRYEAGQFADAAAVWQQAAQAFASQGDVLNRAMVLSNLSLTYQQLGQWSQATEAITNSLQLLKTGQARGTSKEQMQILAQALNTQGSLQLALGQSEQALTTWQQAAATYTQAGDNAGSYRALINQAQALEALGLYRRALQTLTQVGQKLQAQPDSLLKAAGLRSLGDALQTVGDLKQSLRALEQSLAVAVRLQSPPAIAAALFSLGNTARAQRNKQAALEFYQQAYRVSTSPTKQTQAQLNQLSLLLETEQMNAALALWPQIQQKIANLPPSRASVYARINFAQSLTQLRQTITTSAPSWQEIAQFLATAVQQAKSIKDSRAEAYALGKLGGVYEQRGQWSSAEKLTQQALFLAQTINAPDIAYRWQWQLGRLLKTQKDNKGALAAYDQAVKTLQSLRSDLVAINPEVQFSFRDSVEPVYREFVALLLQRTGTSEVSQENLIQARSVIESLQLAELDNFFQAACLNAKPVQIDQLVDQKDTTAAVVYPIILQDRLEVILKLPQQPLRHYATRVAQSKVESTLEQLRQVLTLPYTRRRSQLISKQVYDWLIKPAEADLAKSQIKTLVFVLDGSLRNIPMAALYDGNQYLVQKYGVALTPGLQLLAPQPLERGHLKALTAGLTQARYDYPELPYVANEMAQIKSEMPTEVLLDQQFTKLSLKRDISSSPISIVHLATHGQFSSQADETYIVSWDGRININDLDNLLRNRGQSRPSAIELLVLSACRTAAGDRRAALGLAGVAARAGARSTLATLWFINDQSTALLMGEFYRQLLDPNVNKAEALRRAQESLLLNPQYQHPRYWAPFVLVGNWF